jgi:hypothetical protein
MPAFAAPHPRSGDNRHRQGIAGNLFSVAGAVMTYLAAAQDGAVYDARLALLDAQLGFRWSGWLGYVESHPLLKFAFAVAYGSLLAQVVFSVW